MPGSILASAHTTKNNPVGCFSKHLLVPSLEFVPSLWHPDGIEPQGSVACSNVNCVIENLSDFQFARRGSFPVICFTAFEERMYA